MDHAVNQKVFSGETKLMKNLCWLAQQKENFLSASA